MAEPVRVRGALLDVLAVLISAAEAGRSVHGWAIKKVTSLSGATTYKILDRLEDAGWITGHWEDPSVAVPGKPPRRYYDLTPSGAAAARSLLAERRPQALGTVTAPGNQQIPGYLSGFLAVLRRPLHGGAR